MKNFFTFEGCEGAGKSTQIKLLSEYLTGKGVPCIVTREPGGVKVAEEIRNIILHGENISAMCEFLLYSAARAEHLEKIILPALSSGKIVLCDRYTDSSIAYQGVARKMGVERIRAINKEVAGDAVPEKTIFLDITPSEAFARKGGADMSDRLEREGLAFHERVYKGYKEIAKKESKRFVCVNGAGSEQEVFARILEVLHI